MEKAAATATAAAAAGKAPKRLATLVGCNYTNTRHQLNGCINDVRAMHHLLVSALAFHPADVLLLTDDLDVPAQRLPTGANIRRALADMISRAAPGDVLFFHFSGHGTLIPPVKPQHSWRRSRDEAIVPCDFNLITDVDFRQLVDRLPAGASFTMISDSCHSGGLIDQEKEQIGPATADRSTSPSRRSGRAIPFDSVLSHLASISGINSPHVGDHLSELFGGEASYKFSKDRQAPEQRRHEDDGDDSDGAILLSGCQADETSADMSPLDTTEGKSYGAFSDAVQTVLRRRMASGTAPPPSNRELVMEAREVLHKRGFEQHPCLYCADGEADKPFLWIPQAPAVHHLRAAM